MSHNSHSYASSSTYAPVRFALPLRRVTTSYAALQTKNDGYYGSHRVRYDPDKDWDYSLYVPGHDSPVEVDLVLPHFRATNQPSDHRLNMYVSNQSGPIKAKICRTVSRSKFYLEVRGGASDVILYLPSDFKGQIKCKSQEANFSPGFSEYVLPHCRINKNLPDSVDDDRVVISTRGKVTFKMWNIRNGTAEHSNAVTFRKLFGYSRRSPSPVSDGDWDFLLDG